MFEIEQTYTIAGLTVLCRAARKTVRRWTIVLRPFMWFIFALGIGLNILLKLLGGSPLLWSLPVFGALLVMLLFGDRFNAWVAQRQMFPGSAHSVTVFTPDAYTVTTDTTETIYQYENITNLCEAEGFFIFFLGNRHGQMFDKSGFRIGDCDEFRTFIEQKTEKTFKKIR